MDERQESSGDVTLSEVARLAGVSGMTVSRVLHDHVNVSEETRAKVQAAVAALGYVPNRLAGALATARTRLMVVIIPSLGNIVFPEVLRGANERFEAAGYQAVIGVSDYDLAKEEQLIAAMQSWRPSGWILAGLEHTPRARQMLREVRSPVVEVMDIDGEPIDMAVGFSNVAAGRDIGKFLADSGRRRIGYVGGNLERDLRAGKRLEGFVQALSERGIALQGRFTADQPSSLLLGRSGLAQLLARHPDLDAVYFSNDDMAVGGLMHCMAAGISVPDQLALAGFNGLEIGEAVPLRLTTIKSPRYRIGQLAADHILARLAGQTPPLREDIGLEFIAGQTA
ncbi:MULTISPECIES: LacI family DNA-binding transcriptional regulator [unclassified Variovorax]|uniref:LacI family DNA-binding transcriptional regulator n=1 Tax=unclassified Variovorax TaxID=663243 RepID=UPI00088C9D47|nr:LacI family DNA-binding transcriptional regulator [Variovorax sp. CF079]SDE82486.1 transcriptional regulator, LacI family [Variovorax sp. CF079]